MIAFIRKWWFMLTLCCFLLPAQQVAGQIVLQAEDATHPGTQFYEAPFQGFHGTGFLGSLEQSGISAVQFAVPTSTAGMYTLTMRYALNLPYLRTLSVYVNGRDVAQAQFAPTGAWDGWATQAVTVYLPKSTGSAANQVIYRYDNDDNGRVNLDELAISSATTPGYSSGSAAASAWPAGLSVDQFSGTAQFAIPLFTITEPGGISVPVGLAYTASGVRVEDDGGMVGTNWSLQADFGIRRVVRGLPDDCKSPSGATDIRWGWLYQNQYPVNSDNLPDAPATCSAQQNARALLDQLGARTRPTSGSYTMYDPEPDIFYYNIPGHSGCFVLDRQGQAHTFPYDPIDIQWGTLADLGALGISSFVITTAEGTVYRMGQADLVIASTSDIKPEQYYFNSDHLAYYTSPGTPGNITYAPAWRLGSILSLAGGFVEFEYQKREGLSYYDMPVAKEEHRFLTGNPSTVASILEYSKSTRLAKTAWLTGIKTGTIRVSFELEALGVNPDNADGTAFYVKAINLFARNSLYSLPIGEGLLKRYTLQYTQAVPDFPNVLPWFDEKGTALDWSEPRRFLRQINLSTGYTTSPLFTFSYAQIGTSSGRHGEGETVPCPLPPLKSINKDYWGFYNANQAKTAIPQLYVYPQLAGLLLQPAGAPYRLFELPTTAPQASGGGQLQGADRRPAADFSVALAGTLTEIAFGTGSKAVLEYEPHRFYDPLAQQTLPAGGVRVRTVKVLDPVTRTETRRDYVYQADEADPAKRGQSSGVLLHAPRLAFAVPATGTSTLQQWQAATVRCGEDMGSDPFEGRIVGYQRVAELVPGRGQTVTVFTAPAGADARMAASIAPAYDGTVASWSRPSVGVANYGGTCPSIAPLPAGPDLYPFALAPALDYQRGLPTSISYIAESIGQAFGRVERMREFSYINQAVAPYTVMGVAYERLGTDVTSPYLYAKSQVVTGYQLVPREEKTTYYTYDNSNNATTRFLRNVSLYNSHGWLAAVARQNSDARQNGDGSFQRTRYRYLADYALSSTSTSETLKGLRQLRAQGIGAEVIETISEVVTTGTPGSVHFRESVIQNYAVEPPKNSYSSPVARPYQLWRLAMAPPLTTRTDTLSLPGEPAPPGQPAYAGWLTATVSEVDKTTLAPISTRVETGRQTRSQHLGYYGTLPILQIAGAAASEVVFSDCETATDFGFECSGNMVALGNSSDARTGQRSLGITAGTFITHSLPASNAARYRLVWWANAAQGTTPTFTIKILNQGNTWSTQTLPLTGTGWQRLEITLPDLSTITAPQQRSSYTLQLSANAAVKLDDLLLLPAEATATSTTYEVTLGKTSETDDRGRTLYYEYSNSGKLARVRDHNKAIVRQLERVVAGRRSDEVITPTFTIEGNQTEGFPLFFSAFGPRRDDLEYEWDFGDGTIAAFSSANQWINHTYSTSGQTRTFTVTLRLRPSGTTTAYTASQSLTIGAPPLQVNIVVTDVTDVDDCGRQPVTTTSSYTNKTTYTAVPTITGRNYTYEWEISQTIAGYTSWSPIQGSTNASITQTGITSRDAVRCRIVDTASNEEAVSYPASVNHYNSTPDCQ